MQVAMPEATTPIAVPLDDVTRKLLEEVASGQTLPHRDVMRAKMILLVADGASLAAVARRLDTPRLVVRKWVRRFKKLGLRGLNDAPRSGRPPRFSPDRGRALGEARLRAT